MRFSIRLNNDLPLADVVALAQTAEAAGFDQFWISNDLFLRSAPVILGALGRATTRIELGIGILNPYTIHPGEMAMMAATLDELTGCRFNLGLAPGAANFLQWVGLNQEKPLAMMRETIGAIRGLLAGDRVRLEGRFLQWTDEAYLRFDAPRVTPIYLGALGPGMLRLAGELADGVLPLLFPPEHYFGVLPLLEAGMQRRSPALADLDLAACLWVSLSEDREAARRVLAEKIAYYGPSLSPLILERLSLTHEDFEPIERAVMADNDMDRACQLVDERMLRIGVVGDPEALIDRLEPLVAAGVRHLSFGPPLGPEPLAAIRLLGQQVLPCFRDDRSIPTREP
ncbi:LLM class flavin-dependent oxidoreductase [Candidatus Entotheonella palauensis]|uniref:LLM class flavin-dependent oxidoreductase n=1 Tax=Candidatus Entotheonella palauensis TaxID=93172 RepID=UPI000B7E56A4|nr:LLM class flavin-dependent oxidoreductase [Candidatus Entotheonella palauensis]